MTKKIDRLPDLYLNLALSADQGEANGCEDHDKGSECCTVLNIPLIKDHPKVLPGVVHISSYRGV